MVENIETPPTLIGDTRNQIAQIWNYLYRTSETMNRNLVLIGNNELKKEELEQLRTITGNGIRSGNEVSLKDAVMATAVQAIAEAEEANRKANDAMEILTGFVEGKGCGAATDLNGLTDQGTYYITEENAASAVNAPDTSKSIFVLVIRRLLTAAVDTVYQFAYCGTNLYRRNNGHVSESGWTQWKQLY